MFPKDSWLESTTGMYVSQHFLTWIDYFYMGQFFFAWNKTFYMGGSISQRKLTCIGKPVN